MLGPRPASALMRGVVLDASTGTPVAGALIHLAGTSAPSYQTQSDSLGAFLLDLPIGRWQIEVERLGYALLRQPFELTDSLALELRLTPLPLLMTEMVVLARRPGEGEHSPAFVEHIPVETASRPGADLPRLLAGAVGVQVRRYGGLGSFSTASIRGSTAEQVQIFLDGVPLNQALGGGVDLGALSLAGVESIEVYRGAVPARFSGNSIGGVVNIRTRKPGEVSSLRLHAGGGSFATRQFSATASSTWKRAELMGLLAYNASRNDFRFLDDNGTEYNLHDDLWTRRANSDFRSLNSLVKISRPWGRNRLLAHTTLDLSLRGIPGISNNQALHTRYDTWSILTELELFGPAPWTRAGYRLSAYHLLQRGEYQDLFGEVGIGTQHDRNTTRSMGLRAELDLVLPRGGLLTAFANARQERFEPHSLLQPQSRLLTSQRQGASAGAEVEIPFLKSRFKLNVGAQLEALHDRFFGQNLFGASTLLPARGNTALLASPRFGFNFALANGWTLQGHRGFYSRPPSFYELFGDRGTVLGNTDLRSEQGKNGDLGLVYHGTPGAATGLLLAEVAYYRNEVENLIRFVQNSQRVSRPHNIGRARLSGMEIRAQTRPLAWLELGGNYTYQHAENHSPFSYEHGKELPNAPRHSLEGHLSLSLARLSLHYALNYESRHFLDRANLRPVPVRSTHSLGMDLGLGHGATLSCEGNNLTDNQVADLWGYPLPGRAFFLSLKQNLNAPFK
jgi:iron complex outermembrane receptor protein